MAQGRGAFIIKNAAGSVTLAGLAALVNSNNSAGLTDATEIQERRDSTGVPRALTKNFNMYQLDLDLTPGIGGAFASKNALQLAFLLIPKGSSIVTSGFDVASYNWDSSEKAIVWECACNLNQDGDGTLRVTARRYRALGAAGADGTVIDFATGPWTAF